jgi:arylsulfatase A-like enzyme
MGRQEGNDTSDFKLRAGFPPLPLMEDESVMEEQPDLAGLTERYTERAVSYIRRHANGPFFLYLAHMYVHRPLYAQNTFLKRSQNGVYGASVACVDWSTSVLVHELEMLGIRENTLLIFTSDNGSRGDPAEGCSNLPLRGPRAAPGRRAAGALHF